MAHDPETRSRAEEMFVIDGATLDEVAEALEIPSRTLAAWSAEGRWVANRREYRDAEGEIKRYARIARLKLIKDAMTSLDPQKVYAFATLERTMTSQNKDLDSGFRRNDGIDDIEIKTPQEAISALQEAIDHKVMVMLADPTALNLKAIKELKQARDLVDEMAAKYAKGEDTEKLKGASIETIKTIHRDILRIKES